MKIKKEWKVSFNSEDGLGRKTKTVVFGACGLVALYGFGVFSLLFVTFALVSIVGADRLPPDMTESFLKIYTDPFWMWFGMYLAANRCWDYCTKIWAAYKSL